MDPETTDQTPDASDNRRGEPRLEIEQHHPASTATLTVQGIDHACFILNFSACGLCLQCPEELVMAVGDPAMLSTSPGEAEAGEGVQKAVAMRWSLPSKEGLIAGFEFVGEDLMATRSLLTNLGSAAGARDELTGMDWL